MSNFSNKSKLTNNKDVNPKVLDIDEILKKNGRPQQKKCNEQQNITKYDEIYLMANIVRILIT